MKVRFAQPIWRQVEAPHMWSVVQTFSEARSVQWEYDAFLGDALVERARGILATRFLERSSADVLLTVDSDIVFEPKDAVEICEQAMDHDLVCGLYITRSRTAGTAPACQFFEGQEVRIGESHQPVEILWAATGFLAASRRVIEAVAEGMEITHPATAFRHYPLYQPFSRRMDDGELILLSEDYAFCERAREKGFKVYLNPGVHLEHLGTYGYKPEDLLFKPPEVQSFDVTKLEGGRWRIGANAVSNTELAGAGR